MMHNPSSNSSHRGTPSVIVRTSLGESYEPQPHKYDDIKEQMARIEAIKSGVNEHFAINDWTLFNLWTVFTAWSCAHSYDLFIHIFLRAVMCGAAEFIGRVREFKGERKGRTLAQEKKGKKCKVTRAGTKNSCMFWKASPLSRCIYSLHYLYS